MWTHSESRNIFWLGIEHDFEELLVHLYAAEAEEESSLFLLKLHLENKDELSVFNSEELKEINHLLTVLIGQTRRHHRMMSHITRLLTQFKKGMHKV